LYSHVRAVCHSRVTVAREIDMSVERDPCTRTGTLRRVMPAGMVHQNSPHHLRGDAEELRPVCQVTLS
jgi:hypothetical protein